MGSLGGWSARRCVRRRRGRCARAMHPVRAAKYAVTPRLVRQASRVVYTITNPLGAAENELIGAALNAGGGHCRPAKDLQWPRLRMAVCLLCGVPEA